MKQNMSYGFDKLEELKSHVLSFFLWPKNELLVSCGYLLYPLSDILISLLQFLIYQKNNKI
jgi:hypothetical protein